MQETCVWFLEEEDPLEKRMATQSLLMKVKEGSEKANWKLSIQKTNIMASCLSTSWQIEGEKVVVVADFIFCPKSLWMVTAPMKLKDTYSLEGKLWPTYTAN